MKRKISVISSEKDNWKGEIEILTRNDKVAYVKWVVYNQNNELVASFTNNYFIGDREYGDNEIFSLVKDCILNYRLKRKKIFENVIFP